jgi:hypothetical protein
MLWHKEEKLVATRTNQAAAQRTHRLFQGFPRLCKSSGTPHACIHRFARGDEKALARQTEWPESEKKSRKSQLVAHGHVVRGVFESAWFHGRGAEAPTSSAQLSNRARPGPPSQPCSERPATAAGRRWGVRSRLPKGSMPWPRLTSCDCCITQGPVDPCEGRLAGACSSALDVRPYAQQPAWRAREFGRHRIAVSVCGVRTAEASNKPCRLKTTGTQPVPLMQQCLLRQLNPVSTLHNSSAVCYSNCCFFPCKYVLYPRQPR